MKDIRYPARTVLAYEGSGGVLAFGHHDFYESASVVFCDGHAADIDSVTAEYLLWSNPRPMRKMLVWSNANMAESSNQRVHREHRAL